MGLQPFDLERYFAKHEFSAKHLLCSSDCESVSIDNLLGLEEGARERFMRLKLGYTESQGSPELREEIARLYTSVTPEEIVVFVGAGEGVFTHMHVALESGERVIVQQPSYQSLHEVARAQGCTVLPWTNDRHRSWDLDINELKHLMNKKPAMLVVNFPHNPTGYIPDHETFEMIVETARAEGVSIFSDEVYRGLEYDKTDQLPAMVDAYENGVSLGVMSKAFGLPGLRVGWLISSDAKLRQRWLEHKDYTTICGSAPSEFLATIALRHGEQLLQRNLDIIKRNVALLDGFFERHSTLFSWTRPRAGSVAFPRYKGSGSIEQLCDDVVERYGVMLMPGTKYGFDDRQFRIGFGRANMPEALARFEEYIADTLH